MISKISKALKQLHLEAYTARIALKVKIDLSCTKKIR